MITLRHHDLRSYANTMHFQVLLLSIILIRIDYSSSLSLPHPSSQECYTNSKLYYTIDEGT